MSPILVVSPFCHQVVLMLTSDLDGDEDKDKAALDNLLTQVLGQLDISGKVSLHWFTFIFKFRSFHELGKH